MVVNTGTTTGQHADTVKCSAASGTYVLHSLPTRFRNSHGRGCEKVGEPEAREDCYETVSSGGDHEFIAALVT